MKKLITVIIILSGIFLITCFIPITSRNKFKIAAAAIKISMQLNNPENWLKWHPVLQEELEKDSTLCSTTLNFKNHLFDIKTATLSVSVKSSSGTQFKVATEEKGKSSDYDVFLSATQNINLTEVTIDTKMSVFTWMFSINESKIKKTIFIDHLKTFMENDSLYYGYPIEIRKVADTNVVVLNRQVATKEKFTVLDTMFKELNAYALLYQLSIMGAPIMQYNELPSDSVSVLTMLSVNKQAKSVNEIRTVRMPVNGRMLVGHYEGKYKDRIQLKTAMQQYIMDKNITSIVNTYEKFLNGKLPENEETLVKMEIYFPIL